MRRYLQSTVSRHVQAERIASGSILSVQSRRSSSSSSTFHVHSDNSTSSNATADKGKAPEHVDTSDPSSSTSYGLQRGTRTSFQNKKWGKYAPLSSNAAVRHRNPNPETVHEPSPKTPERAFELGDGELPNEDFAAPELAKKKARTHPARRNTSAPSSSSGVTLEQLDELMRKDGQPSSMPSLDGNVEPLRSTLQQQKARLLSKENQEWAAAEQERESLAVESEEDQGDLSFSPGTFVEVRKNEVVRQGIVLHEFVVGRQWRVLTLGSTGETFAHVRSDVHFSIPNYISSDLAERCGQNLIHENPGQLEARVAALKKLQVVITEAEKASYGAKNVERQRHFNIYNHCKSPDPNKWGKVSVADITKLIYTEPTALHYFGMHKYFMRLPVRYVSSPDYYKTQTFYVRPENDVNEIQSVKDWITKYRMSRDKIGPYSAFLSKAKDILKSSSRPFQGGDQDTGPITQQPAPYSFDETDKVFIGFLLRSMRPHVTNQSDPYTIGRIEILKDLLKHEEGVEYTDATVHEVLIRLGVLPAWKDLTELQADVNGGYSFEMAPFLKEKGDNIVKRGVKSTATAGTVLGPEDFHPRDPLESVRRDFGNMPVYVIDDLSAEELDDGISIEKITGEPENRWIHVHIADPASVIHPGHVLARTAKEQGASFYLLQRSYPLFPKSLMHHPVYGMSLGDGIKHGRPDKCLTFSAKIDGQGNVLDYKIAAGLLRNVKKLSYASVDKSLGITIENPDAPFGHSYEVPLGSAPEPADVETLRDIYRVAKLLERKRFENGCLQPHTPSVEMKTSSIPQDVHSVSVSGSKYSGFPQLSYFVSHAERWDVGAHTLVAEMMKLACSVCSMIARDNNLPIIRRGIEPYVFVSDEARQSVFDSRTPQGYIHMLPNLHKFMLVPPSINSTAVMGHTTLGVSEDVGYSRVTSPLRRFQDLVCHWQLHHLLLGSNTSPPWSFTEMETLIRETTIRDRVATGIHRQDTRFFALMFLKRWLADSKLGLERPFAEPLEDMEAYLRSDVRRDRVNGYFGASVFIPKLGINAHLVDLDIQHEGLPVASLVRVKAKRVDLGVQRPALQVTLKDVVNSTP
ncbi:hypothetical protein CVT24_002172 [Panaeolus cyanescens]|uniref:RNB domain-containing protein n=1 Tax=Panaeolus cyanescens TaxID=181874 RepID=A0A409YHV4_9AGAR|nr:hypothetical protein CVT24_002172 [Panaeolus cyanescens]